jgi:large subunit ribosomal protein L4
MSTDTVYKVKVWSSEVFRQQGTAGSDSKEELNSAVFCSPCGSSVIHQVTSWQRAKARQGTRKAKTKAEVSLSKKKPWKQKGTGRARAGSSTSPLWVGGGVAHGPQPYVFSAKLPKKVRVTALKGALTNKAENDRVVVIDSFSSLTGKTREVVRFLKTAELVGESCLVVAGDNFEMVKRACGNIQKVTVLPPIGVNVYDLLRHKYVVVDKSGLQGLSSRLAN